MCDWECIMSIGTLLLIVLILLLLGAVPAWPYSRSWGYYPSGLVGVLLLVVIVLMLAGAFANATVH
jgi:flagellin-like protein